MSGGAGSAGGSGGMGQQPMGNAGAQPGGGIPSYAQPYMNNLGGGMGNASAQPYDPTGGAPRQSPNQSNFGQGMNTMFGGGSPFGMQQQQPYGMQPMQNPFGGQQQQPNQPQSFEQYRATPRMQDQAMRSPEQQLQQDQQAYQNYRNSFGQPQGQQQMQNPFDQQAAQAFMRHQQMGPDPSSDINPGQQPMSQRVWASNKQFQPGTDIDAAYRNYTNSFNPQPGAANQMPEPMGQPGAEGFPPAPGARQQPSYMNNPDFQAYQKQEQDLGRQMNEYMQKAPMFQQLQDLQGKLRGFQQPQQGQMGDTGFRAMPAVMPQQPDPRMMDALTLYSPETYGNQRIDNRMGMPDYGRGGYGGGRGAFGGRMGGGFGGRGGYGRQMPQQDYGYGQMQNQMQQQAQFGQQQRQQYGGLDALQQYLQPPSYRPPVMAPQPLNPGLTAPPPPPPLPPSSGYDGGPPLTGGF
jgi:hypothetical protein